VRAATVALLLLAVLTSQPAGAVGFLTQKELVGRDGQTLIVLPAYTYVTVLERFGDYALISYRVDDQVHELRVRQGDLDAARPDELLATQTADPGKLVAYYRERVPFDIYIDEFPGACSTVPDESSEKPTDEPPPLYRMKIKTRNLTPEPIPHMRFEVQIYLDPPQPDALDMLWQFRVLSADPRQFRTVQTEVFSIDMLRPPQTHAPKAPQTDSEPAAQSGPAAEGDEADDEASAAEESEPPEPPTMRYAVRLFIDELFVVQKTGVVRQIDEEKEEGSIWRLGPRSSGNTSMLRRRTSPSWLPPQ
jgi:hypothetical protein